MNIHQQTAIEIDFSRGEEITPTIVDANGQVLDNVTSFSRETHQWEELLDYITYWENSYCEVYL